MRLPCKECGSTHFGSSLLPDGSWQRLCHGHTTLFADGGRAACSVTWHVSEDWRHVANAAGQPFGSKEEHEEYLDAMRNGYGCDGSSRKE